MEILDNTIVITKGGLQATIELVGDGPIELIAEALEHLIAACRIK